MHRFLQKYILLLFSLLTLLFGCVAVIDYARELYIRLDSDLSRGAITITLNNTFIEKYKNRTTIDVKFMVDMASRRPKPAFLDGDFHIAGRIAEVGLPVVVEIKNSAYEQKATDIIHHYEGTGTPIHVSGAWRIWFEHAGRSEEVQGEKLEAFFRTNPDHVFEIHPTTYVKDRSTLDSFRPVNGYHPGDANDAFENYERTACAIIPREGKTSIVTGKGEFNDVEFMMEIAEGAQAIVQDGRFVDAVVRDLQGNLLVEKKIRMVFIKDTEPEKIVKRLKPGDRLHIFGLPRINLAAVARETEREKKGENKGEKINLPYEIIVVGVYDNSKK